MQKPNKRFTNLKLNKKMLILAIAIFLLASCIIVISTQVLKQIKIKQLENKPLIEAKTKEVIDMKTAKIVIKFNSIDGIETIKYISPKTNSEVQLNCNGKMTVAIDYEAKDLADYEFKIKLKNKAEQTETLHFELPRIKGNYKLIDGMYVDEPDLSGFEKDNTRYLYSDNQENLVPGNWITDSEPENWYNYKNQKWANIYVETNGLESSYVWIPRYVYKVDTDNSVTGNERMDVKFINTYNEYINGETGEKLSFEQLENLGYKLPEAFTWKNEDDVDLIIPGYWMSKYQLSELDEYKINYSLVSSKTTFNVNNFTNNLADSASKYTYAINGKIVHESTSLEDYSFENTTPDQINYINITALNSNGNIIGSMTKKMELTEANPPDLTGFDKDTTFYVYWDENGVEHNEIPISQEPPKDWYNYSYSEWANIVTRTNGLESYYVWIPRYQYSLDQTSQRSNVQFILGTGTETLTGYKIPEAFTWGDNGEVQLTGYWMTKYQLSIEETKARIATELSAGSNLIRVGDITGTEVITKDSEENDIDVPLKYEYYINGNKVYEGTNRTEKYVYTGLEANTTYTINIIARNQETNAYVGAITQKITTLNPYEPDLTGFDKDTTFYVIYNDDGTEKERISIKKKAPSNWYDYSSRKWANIVTTANETESYFVWIPRYEYRILTDRANESLENKRTDVNFITTDINNDNCTTGYKVPEAFTWGDNGEVQLKGYWMSKYQLN